MERNLVTRIIQAFGVEIVEEGESLLRFQYMCLMFFLSMPFHFVTEKFINNRRISGGLLIVLVLIALTSFRWLVPLLRRIRN